MHFMVIKSLIFGSEAHYASRQKRYDYSDKQRSLLNYFFALIRVRDPSCLVFWAIVGIMGMLTTGARVKHFKNDLIKAFSVGEAVSDAHFDQLFQETKWARIKLLSNQAIGHHSFDNYNRDHPIAVRDDHGSIYHVGLVYNFTRARAFCVPAGSTVKQKSTGQLWTVESSCLIDYWTCKCILSTTAESGGETLNKEIHLLSIDWNIETVPGSPGPVQFTYNDQYIPYSMRQKVPHNMTPQKLLFRDQKWMKDPEYNRQMRPYNPREHKDMMCAVYRLRHFFMYNQWCAGENIGESPLDQRVIDSFATVDSILKKNHN
jgi:xanthosine utilization system XapX-like protein